MDRIVLIVDDEADIRDILQFNLENAGFTVETAASAEEALGILSEKHSIILLDVMMGGMSGFQMAEHLRNTGNEIPIVFLTAKDRQDDLLTGFSSGADDYISKPFSIQEVIARVNAVLKRTEARGGKDEKTDPNLISIGKVLIDSLKKTVSVDGEPVAFSKKEFEILNLLASNPGHIYSREDLIDELWKDSPYVLDRTVDVHIARIRSKLGACKNYLTNRSGYGYTFNAVE
jgi:DNA-binding response OmpR family regulator